jgi:hypothetical protein
MTEHERACVLVFIAMLRKKSMTWETWDDVQREYEDTWPEEDAPAAPLKLRLHEYAILQLGRSVIQRDSLSESK